MDLNERFKTLEAASIDAATQGLKAVLLLNGGACLALLAMIANLATSEHLRPEFAPLIPALAYSLLWFAGGAWMTAVSWMFSYWANQAYAAATINPQEAKWSKGVRLNNAGAFTVALALVAFIWGVKVIAFAMPWAFGE